MKLFYALLFIIFTSCTYKVQAETNTVSTVSSGTVSSTTPSTASAPSIVINQNDICQVGIGIGLQSQILGIAGSKTFKDLNCERLKLSTALYRMSMKVSAIAVLCEDERVWSAMMMSGTPCPIDGKIGNDAKAIWDANPERVPGYVPTKETKKIVQQSEKKYSAKSIIGAVLFTLVLL